MARHLKGHVERGGSHGKLGLQEDAGLLDRRLDKESELCHGRVGLLQVLLAADRDKVSFGVMVEELEIFR